MSKAAPPAGPKQWDTKPLRHARTFLDTPAFLIARERNRLAKPKSGPADKRKTIASSHRTWRGGDARSRRLSGLLLRASY
jgi:hypothetical protein